MMILTATICFFAGVLLALRFNIKMLAHITLAIVLVSACAAVFGLASIGAIAGDGIIAVIGLQFGYCVMLLLTAMGHMRPGVSANPEPTTVAEAFDRAHDSP